MSTRDEMSHYIDAGDYMAMEDMFQSYSTHMVFRTYYTRWIAFRLKCKKSKKRSKK